VVGRKEGSKMHRDGGAGGEEERICHGKENNDTTPGVICKGATREESVHVRRCRSWVLFQPIRVKVAWQAPGFGLGPFQDG